MRHIILIIIVLITSLSGIAQRFTLSGTVSDEATGQAIEFATVTVKPTGKAVQTDAQGRFSLQLDGGTFTLSVSFVGYTTGTQRVTLNQNRHISIKLKENSQVLQEVVVTAK